MRASKTTPPLYLPIMNLALLRTNPILPPLVLRKYYGKTNFQRQYPTQHRHQHRRPSSPATTEKPHPCHSEHSAPSPPSRAQHPFSLPFRTAPSPIIPSSPPILPFRTQHTFPAIPNAATSILSFRTQRPFPPVILNTVRNLNSLHLHHSQTSHSSPHSKRHGPISAIPSATLSCLEPLPHSAFRTPPILSFRGPPPVIPNTAPFSPVTLNATQPPLPPVIPNTVRNLNSLHIHHPQTSHSSPHSKRHGPNSAIPNTASLPCHPERSVPSPCHSERSVPSLSF